MNAVGTGAEGLGFLILTIVLAAVGLAMFFANGLLLWAVWKRNSFFQSPLIMLVCGVILGALGAHFLLGLFSVSSGMPRPLGYDGRPNNLDWCLLAGLIFGLLTAGVASIAAPRSEGQSRFTVTLQQLLVLILLLSLAFGRYIYRREELHRNQQAISAIKELGGEIFAARRSLKVVQLPEHFGDSDAKYLKDVLGIARLQLTGSKITDKGLENIRGQRHLESLELNNTAISDDGLEWLRDLNSLTSLELRATQVTATGADRLQRALPNCRIGWSTLEAPFNSSPEAVVRLRAMTKLKKLRLWGDAATNDSLANLAGLTELEELDISSSSVTDAGLSHLKDLVHLRRLNLHNLRMKGEGLKYLRGMKQLEDLNLSNTDIGDGAMVHLRQMKELRKLDLTVARITDTGLANLNGLTNMRELNLTSTRITDDGLAHLADMKQLENLTLANVRLKGAGLVHLEDKSRLKVLDLNQTDVTNSGMAHLVKLTQLRHLNLFRTAVGDSGLATLELLPSLQELDLRQTAVTAAAVEKFNSVLPNCHINR